MMTHVYAKEGLQLVAAKGGVERMVKICRLSVVEANKILEYAKSLAAQGHRVLGVASANYYEKELPAKQDDFDWKFQGLISLYDPPRPFVKDVLKLFYHAGIRVKLLTGDFPGTAIAVADEIGLLLGRGYVTGEDVMKASDTEMGRMVQEVTIFA
jgi:Ca2+-transporting ATPase